jgi:hypothetical protein
MPAADHDADYLSPTEFVDSDHPAIIGYAARIAGSGGT